MARYQRLGLGGQVEPVEMGAVLARDLEHVAEASRGDEPDAAPRRSTMAFVTSVVPWASDAHGPVRGSSVAMPFSTPTAGLAGVVGTLHDHVTPDGSRATRSVKVPPTSTPMRTPDVMDTGRLDRSRWSAAQSS